MIGISNIKKFFAENPLVTKVVLTVVAVFAVCFAVGVSVANFSQAAQYREDSAEASQLCEEIKEDISEKSDLIDGKGFDEYCEKIAREKYGYAKPGEYVIYDSSFGK